VVGLPTATGLTLAVTVVVVVMLAAAHADQLGSASTDTARQRPRTWRRRNNAARKSRCEFMV
jgi:hypothetical protein